MYSPRLSLEPSRSTAGSIAGSALTSTRSALAGQTDRTWSARASPVTSSTTRFLVLSRCLAGTVGKITSTRSRPTGRASCARATGRQESPSSSIPTRRRARSPFTGSSIHATACTSTRLTRTRSSRNSGSTSRLQCAPGQTQDLVLGDLSRLDGGRVCHETRDHPIANQVELTGRLTRESGRDVNTALAEHRLHLGQRVRLLDLAYEPGADVIAATVVEIARTLGGQQQTQPRGPRPAQQVLHRFLACGLPHRGEVKVGLIEHQDGLKRSIRGRSSTDPAPDFHHELCNPELHVLAAAEKLGADDAQPRLSRSCVAAEPKQDLDLEWLAPGRQQITVVEPKRLQVLDQLVEELDIEPADLIDEAGVLIGDETEERFNGHGVLGVLLAHEVNRPAENCQQ